ARPVDADDENDARFTRNRETTVSVRGDELLDDGLEPVEELRFASGLALLEPFDDLDSRRNPDVGPDERLLDSFPRGLVRGVEEQVVSERAAAARERVA